MLWYDVNIAISLGTMVIEKKEESYFMMSRYVTEWKEKVIQNTIPLC